MIEASFQNKRSHDVILTPVASEKSAQLEDEGKHVSLVDPRVSKIKIKQAIEAIFNMKVASMNTQNRQGKAHHTCDDVGCRKNAKRTIISLREGSIDIYGDAVG